MKAEHSRLIPRKPAENLELVPALIVEPFFLFLFFSFFLFFFTKSRVPDEVGSAM